MREIIILNILGIIINSLRFDKYLKLEGIERVIGQIVSIGSLILILKETLIFNTNSFEYQGRFEVLGYNFGYDGIGLSLIGLICILDPILLLLVKGESKNREERRRIVNTILILKIFLIVNFGTLDLFLFFISFELILIPMFLLITRYGSSYTYFLPRLEAGIRFLLYTIIGSLFMLISIIILYIKFGTTSNEILNIKLSNSYILLYNGDNLLIIKIIWILLFISFIIKIPMFPLHTWLPLAHSDAPTIGSIVLAALLLKLGTFGIIRYSLLLFSNNTIGYYLDIYEEFIPLLYILGLLSIYYASILSIRSLYDLKKIIAYSSIIHMNFSIYGFFSKDIVGLLGSTFLMFTHAFISSGLFLLVGILYKRYHTRYLYYYQGLFTTLPVFSIFFLLFTFANISLPFCSSFLSEFFILISSFDSNPFILLLLVLSLILSSSSFMWITIRILYGSSSSYFTLSNNNIGYKDLSLNEFIALLPLLFLTIYFTFYPNFIISFFTLVLYPII